MRPARLFAIILAAATLAWAGASPAADALRGRALYEAGCEGCHSASVHGRDKRIATDYESVRGWVRRWSENLGLKWTDAEVADVAAHLNARYYRFACPPTDCRATGSRDTGGSRLALDDRRP